MPRCTASGSAEAPPVGAPGQAVGAVGPGQVGVAHALDDELVGHLGQQREGVEDAAVRAGRRGSLVMAPILAIRVHSCALERRVHRSRPTPAVVRTSLRVGRLWLDATHASDSGGSGQRGVPVLRVTLRGAGSADGHPRARGETLLFGRSPHHAVPDDDPERRACASPRSRCRAARPTSPGCSASSWSATRSPGCAGTAPARPRSPASSTPPAAPAG